MTDDQLLRRQRIKNLAVAWTVAGLAVLFFVITVVRLMGAGHL